MRKPVELTVPDTLDPVHAALLREHHFETAGRVEFVMRGFAYDGMRVLYAIANPSATALVYVGDSEVARDLKKRLKDHLDSRRMAGLVEPDSLLFVHVMVTEYMVLDRFEEETGRLPTLNRSKAPKNAGGRHYKVALARASIGGLTWRSHAHDWSMSRDGKTGGSGREDYRDVRSAVGFLADTTNSNSSFFDVRLRIAFALASTNPACENRCAKMTSTGSMVS